MILNDLNIANLINFNNGYNDSDSNEGFIQRLLAVTANVDVDDYSLLGRHIAALRGLLNNHSFNILPSNKGEMILIIHSTHYNNKMIKWQKTHTKKFL